MGNNVGGRVDIRIGGEVYHPVAEVSIEPVNVEVEVVDNQDGTIGRSVKSHHFACELTIRDAAGLDPNRLFVESFDFSMVEREMGRSILLTNAFAVGRPKRNTVNGEISGITIVSAQYQVV
jgi:hypothetical protein